MTESTTFHDKILTRLAIRSPEECLTVSASSKIQSLSQSIQRLVDVMSMATDLDWPEELHSGLNKLKRKVDCLALAPMTRLDPTLEIEFYSLIESHPKSRQAAQVMHKEELLEICKQGILYYTELQKRRPLTVQETKQLRIVEKECQVATDEWNQFLRRFLEEMME